MQIGFFSKFLIRLACADPSKIKDASDDLASLKNLGLQLLLIFLFMFLVHGYAISIMAGKEWLVGFGLAILTSAIMISFDRAFLVHDYLIEGELLYFRRNWDEKIKLSGIIQLWLNRLLFGSVRLGIAFFLSFCFALFAEPGVLRNEVQQVLNAQERWRNAPFYEALASFEKSHEASLSKLEKESDAIRRSTAKLEEQQAVVLSEEPNANIVDFATTPTKREENLSKSIADDVEEIEKLTRNVARLRVCAQAEGSGTVVPEGCSSPNYTPSGNDKCGPLCKGLLKQVDVEEKQAQEIQFSVDRKIRELKQLENNRETRFNTDRQARLDSVKREQESWKTRKETLENSIKSARAETKKIEERIDKLKRDHIVAREREKDNLKSRGLYDESGVWGLVRSFEALDILKGRLAANSGLPADTVAQFPRISENTDWIFGLVKYLIVVLEISVLLSRALSSTKAYSLRLYRDYAILEKTVRYDVEKAQT